jgi:hypothetical protein
MQQAVHPLGMAPACVAPASRRLCTLFFRFLFQSVRSFAEYAITLPPDSL